MTFDALLFDFDGVLIESEYLGNKHIADFLTARGHAITPEQSMANFMGLSGRDFIARVEAFIGGPLPTDWTEERMAENDRVLAEGIEEVWVVWVGMGPNCPALYVRTHDREVVVQSLARQVAILPDLLASIRWNV